MKTSFEHISTKVARDFVLSKGDNVVATITPGFCTLDLRAVFNGITMDDDGNNFHYDLKKNGVYPSMVMRPIPKEIKDLRAIQEGLVLQAKNGLRKFGLGTDTAPHLTEHKHREGGSCGQFWAPHAHEMYAWIFERLGILDDYPRFACDIMPDFYGIKDKLPKKTVTLKRMPLTIQDDYNGIIPPLAGQTIPWSVAYEQ
ncbi:MAG: hypothetical protein WDN09_01220 [bacterium]